MANPIKRAWRILTKWQMPDYIRDEPMPDDERQALIQFLARNGAGQEVAALMRATRGETADAMRDWLRTRPKKK